MRKPVIVGAGAVLAVVAVLATVLLLVPALREHRDRAWQSAGDKAVAALDLPSQFRPVDSAAASTAFTGCNPAAPDRCFVVGADPVDSVDAVRAAVAPLATGPVRQACGPEPLGAPDKCHLFVPVDGSELLVMMYGRAVRLRPSTHTLITRGSYVQVVVAPR
jgi:hypothetical protein